jgi:hypothetical protein
MTTRRNLFIRSIVTFSGDFALGYSMATICVWIIQSAALGVFLSFLLWLLAIILVLALSQFVVRPAIAFVLSDRKLDRGIDALSGLVDAARSYGLDLRAPLLHELQQRMARFMRPPGL